MATYIPQLVGAGELQKNASSVIKKIAESSEESVIVNRNIPVVVIMSIQRYEQLRAHEEHQLKPFQTPSLDKVRDGLQSTGKYSKDLIEDITDGLKKSSFYSNKKK